MNSQGIQHPAEQRLLEAALEQVYGGEAFEAAHAASRRQSRSPRQWLQVALFLFGLGVTALVLWQARDDVLVGAQDPWQNPAHYGTEHRADGRIEIEALPADITNLSCFLLEVKDLELLKRFQSLRRLQVFTRNVHIGKIDLKIKHKSWATPPADVFTPIASLPLLETLTLPMQVDLTGQHLAPLSRSPRLRELWVMGEQIPLTADCVAAMQKLSLLTSLRLDLVRADAEVIARLRKLGLRSMQISRCPGFDEKAFAEICATPTLQSLSFDRMGTRQLGNEGNGTYWLPSTEVLSGLKELPRLRQLRFSTSLITGEELRALPETISSLELWATELLPDDYRALRRFGSLRQLKVRTARQSFALVPRDSAAQEREAANVIADTLARLQLRQFVFQGAVTELLLRELGLQPALEDLQMLAAEWPSLDPLAQAPKLRSLQLASVGWRRPGSAPCSLDDLRPMTACRSLKALTLVRMNGLQRDEVSAVFGANVVVTAK